VPAGSGALPCPQRWSTPLPRTRSLGGASSKKFGLLPPGPDSAEAGVQQTLAGWEPQSCPKPSRAPRESPGLPKRWVQTRVQGQAQSPPALPSPRLYPRGKFFGGAKQMVLLGSLLGPPELAAGGEPAFPSHKNSQIQTFHSGIACFFKKRFSCKKINYRGKIIQAG